MSIPLTVVGGYLGSGKTTLINRSLFLTGADSLRGLAILVNDFGSVNVDAALIRSRSPDGRVLGLAGGCVCCAVQQDLGRALEDMRKQSVDHVVIEASGVASPAKILSYGRDWPGYRPRGSVVVVNGATLAARLADRYVGSLVARQIEEAGLVALHSGDDFCSIGGVRAARADDPRVLETVLDAAARLPAGADVSHTKLPEFDTMTLRQRGVLEEAKLAAWLAELPKDVSRVKGFALTAGGPRLVQWAAGSFELGACAPSASYALVVIAPKAAAALAGVSASAAPHWKTSE